MSATNKTPNLDLPQWVQGDEIEREDFNEAFDAIDTTVAAHLAESASKHITESGTNTNGSYIKFDDGTLICWLNRSKGYDVMTAGNHRDAWVFPAVFSDKDYFHSFHVLTGSADAPKVIATSIERRTDRSVTQTRGHYTLSTNFGSAGDVAHYAIGRWK